MIKDPALGRTKAERALGKEGVRTDGSRSKQFYGTRVINTRIFSGPRNSYGTYSVSDQAMDAIRK